MSRLSRFTVFILSAPFLCAAGFSPDTNTAAVARAQSALAQLPLRFEVNQGQGGPAVRYTAHASGYTLLLKEDGPSLAFADSRRVDISLLNSNRAPAIEALERLSTRTNYLIGNNSRWRSNVPSYERVRYHDVYPGIDIVYYGKQSQLEYDFVLEPGADPNAIRMRFRGAGRLSISPDGDLIFSAGKSQLAQKRPVVFQDGHQVACRYALTGRNTVGLELAGYDRERKLVIDPVISYLSYFGGTGLDQINAVKMGPNNLLYIAGQTDTSQLPTTADDYDGSNKGLTDIFFAVIDTSANFNLVYMTYLGGTNDDIPLAMDVDTSGVAYLTGTTTSTDFPMAGAFQTTGSASVTNSFVVKLDPSQMDQAALVFSSYLGGTTGHNYGHGIAVDNRGLIYVIGTTQSTDFPVTGSAYQPVLWGKQDSFLCQIDPNASVLAYSTYLGGESSDDGRAILVDSKGLVYFASSTLSTQFPMAGFSYNGNSSGAEDIVVGVMDMTKSGPPSLVYASYFGGSGNEEVRAMAFDAKGRIMITGYTLSTDLPVTGDALQSTNAGSGDAFVAVFDPTKNFQAGLVYSTYLGGSGGDVAYAIAGDAAGNIYVTGYTLSADFPITNNALQNYWADGTDVFITAFKPGVAGKAALGFSTYLGLSGTYVSSGLSLGSDGSMYVVGRANVGLPTIGNALQPGGFAGGLDGFIAVIGPLSNTNQSAVTPSKDSIRTNDPLRR
jgi:hypothetical protein